MSPCTQQPARWLRVGVPPATHSRVRGLTLVELVVVLTILVVLATVALTSITGRVDQQRYEGTRRTLDHVRDAVVGDGQTRQADGTPVLSGFIVDMNRLPVATVDADDASLVTLSELWFPPAGVALFALRDGLDASIAAADQDPNPGIRVPCGWRGPYLRLPTGSDVLRDSFGKRLVSPADAATEDDGENYAHLRQIDDTPAEEGDTVAIIRSLGANRLRDALDVDYDEDLEVVIDPLSYRVDRIVVNVTVRYDSARPYDEDDRLFVRMYEPDPATGLVRAVRVQRPVGSTTTLIEIPDGGLDDMGGDLVGSVVVQATFVTDPDDSSANAPETNFGSRVIRAYIGRDDDGNNTLDDDLTPPTTTSSNGRPDVFGVSDPYYLMAQPGLNVVNLTVDVTTEDPQTLPEG